MTWTGTILLPGRSDGTVALTLSGRRIFTAYLVNGEWVVFREDPRGEAAERQLKGAAAAAGSTIHILLSLVLLHGQMSVRDALKRLQTPAVSSCPPPSHPVPSVPGWSWWVVTIGGHAFALGRRAT